MKKYTRRDRGFTLIELIVGMTIVTIISVVVASIISVSTTTVNNVQTRKKIVVDGANTANRFLREFEALVSLINVSPSSVRFSYLQSAVASDDTVTVEYSFANGGFFRQRVGIGSPMIVTDNVNVDSSGFTYYTQGDDPTSTLVDVWRTRLNLYMTSTDQSVRFITDVFPGN